MINIVVTGLTGTKYQLDQNILSDGGEGEIYRVLGGTNRMVAKLYKAGITNPDLEKKLAIMVKMPPNAKVLSQVAWPLDVVYDYNNQFCGFIMPELNINDELGEIYKYPSKLNISTHQKLIIAENICAVISEVHKAGYVFGDFNPRNIGVDKNTGNVAFLDTDSYHVVDSSKGIEFRCVVYLPGYLAPELIDKYTNHLSANPSDKNGFLGKLVLPTFTRETDNFALAIHIFKLLFNGYTPYGGIIETDSASQSSPGMGDAAVRRDNYCFKPGFKHQAVAIPTLESFPQEISDLFTRAFMFGRLDPKQRPTATEWHAALVNYENSLTTCRFNQLHQYDKQNIECPLCEADARYGLSMAPQITQKSYTPIVQAPVQQPTYSSGSSSASRPYSPPKNWWQKLSFKAKIGLGTVAAGVAIFTIGAIAGWFGGSSNVPITPATAPALQNPNNEPSTAASPDQSDTQAPTPRPQLTDYSFSFTDTTRLDEYWTKIEGAQWRFDGENGYHINDSGYLVLTDILPIGISNYTVEFEVAATGEVEPFLVRYGGDYVNLFLGVDNNGEYGDLFSFKKYLFSESIDIWSIPQNEVSNFFRGLGTSVSNNIYSLESDWMHEGTPWLNEYITIKLVVDNKYVDIYINDEYATSRDLLMENSAFVLYGARQLDKHSYHIRNFSINVGNTNNNTQQDTSIEIQTPVTRLSNYEFSFTDTTRLSEYWNKIDGTSWRFAGEKGYHINDAGLLVLTDILPTGLSNYTIEFNARMEGELTNLISVDGEIGTYFIFLLGVDNSGKYGDLFLLYRNNSSSLSFYYYDGDISNFNINNYWNSDLLLTLDKNDTQEYINVKLVVDNKYVDIFFDDNYMFSRDLTRENSAFAFHAITNFIRSDRWNYYVKDFKIEVK